MADTSEFTMSYTAEDNGSLNSFQPEDFNTSNHIQTLDLNDCQFSDIFPLEAPKASKIILENTNPPIFVDTM